MLIHDRRHPQGNARLAVMAAWFGFWFVYFVLMKRSALRTLGYRLGGVKIVNLRGERPGVVVLTVRMLFVMFGPLNYVIDLLWIASDGDRQALRDKITRTYVIRCRAQPAGQAEIRYKYLDIAGWLLVLPEVPHKSAPARSIT